MKKSALIYLATALALVGCDNKAKEEAENAKALAAATHEELVQAVQERDQLLDIINEITSTTDQIKDVEKIVAINMTPGENQNKKTQITSNLDAIKATLAERRKKLDELEANLRNSKTANNKLLSTIEGLKNQLASQAEEIESLTAKLNTATEHIAKLDVKIDSLSTENESLTQQREQAKEVIQEQETKINECYYAIGSKNELKANNIIEGGGFLRKSKIMEGDFDRSFFNVGDKRTLTTIPLHSDKAKVITKYQPASSYEIIEDNGQKVLRILNPKEFWGVSNYCVIQID